MIDSWHFHTPHNFLSASTSSNGSSSGGSSHLSILTTTSSLSSALSDIHPPAGGADTHWQSPVQSPSHSPTGSTGSKTNAFFGSPFASDSSTPLPPPPIQPPLKRSPSIASTSSARSRSVFLSGSNTRDEDATPRLDHAPPPPSIKKSLNDSFFSTSSDPKPTPPPSIRSLHSSHSIHRSPSSSQSSPASSPPSSPPPARRGLPALGVLPALTTRLFPSRARYTAVDGLPTRESSLHGPHGHHGHYGLGLPFSASPHRREFVELDAEEYKNTPPAQPSPSPLTQSGVSMSPTHSEISRAMEKMEKPKPRDLALLIPSVSTDSPSKLPTPVVVQRPFPPAAQAPAPAFKPGDIITELVVPGLHSTPSHSREPSNESRLSASPQPSPSSSKISFSSSTEELKEGLKLELLRTLGQGAFSSVWLARDANGKVGCLQLERRSSLSLVRSKSKGSLRRAKSKSRRKEKVEGAVPKIMLDGALCEEPKVDEGSGSSALSRAGSIGNGRKASGDGVSGVEGRVVAVKLTDRVMCDKDDRTRVSFVREVEVLKHISHPSIVSFIHAFSTPSHHVLVLEHVSGGELFDLVSSPESHARLDEPLLRRVFGELCRAVAWMHAVGLVHRDIKLENILLTRSPFKTPLSSAPLIKLTDFGLSRFIDPASPLLTTRCGSESYASPELVTGRPYDGRESDAWACGVVLYTLVTRRLPFDSPSPASEQCVKHEEHVAVPGDPERSRVRGPRRDEKRERRALLVRIAKGEYSWPESLRSESGSDDDGKLHGTALVKSEGVRRVVEKLLVRDPRKRTKVAQLWEDEWMRGEGAPPAPVLPESTDQIPPLNDSLDVQEAGLGEEEGIEMWEDARGEQEEDWEDDASDEGVLVDEQDIGPGSVARQEH